MIVPPTASYVDVLYSCVIGAGGGALAQNENASFGKRSLSFVVGISAGFLVEQAIREAIRTFDGEMPYKASVSTAMAASYLVNYATSKALAIF